MQPVIAMPAICCSVRMGVSLMSVSGDTAPRRICAGSPFSSPCSVASICTSSLHSGGTVMPSTRRASARMSARFRPRPGDVVDGALPPTAVLTGSPAAVHTFRMSRIGDVGFSSAMAARAAG